MENTNKEKDYGHMENTEDGMVRIPAVALRGMTVLPGLVIHFDLNRGKSILAVEKAMMSGQRLFLVTQRDVEDEEPDLMASIIWAVWRRSDRLPDCRKMWCVSLWKDSREED